MRLRFPLPFLFLSIVLTGAAVAQSPNGTISGLVLDPAARAIAGADVQIVNDTTGIRYPGSTNGDGIYAVPNLPPGSYRVQVSKIGFKTLIKPDIVLSVQDALAINFTLPVGAVSETVTVEGGAPLVNTESGAVSTVVDRQFTENLPLNGRSFNTLLQLTPGVVIVPAGISTPGQFSVNGQRANANYFTVDGASADFGSTISFSPGPSGGGSVPAFSALGGTSSLVSVDAVEEFRVETSTFAPEFGRTPGGQIGITTRSGTNQLHGALFNYFRNDALDATDWFATRSGLPKSEERQNDFGGVLGGPILRGKTFFFLSYEGLRLRQPQTGEIAVPTAQVRAAAIPSAAAYIDAYPLPNGPSTSAGTGLFTGAYSNKASMDAGSVRIDQVFNSRLRAFARYNESPSSTVSRQDSLSELLNATTDTRTLTLGVDVVITPRLENAFRSNYSTQTAGTSYALDSFGGATPPAGGSLIPSPYSPENGEGIFIPSDVPSYTFGRNSNTRVQQIGIGDDLNLSVGAHQLKFGVDYRSLLTATAPTNFAAAYVLFAPLAQFATSSNADLVEGILTRPGKALFRNLSWYAQDNWKAGTRLVLTFGVRWDMNGAPVPEDGTVLASWLDVNNPAQTALAPSGTPVWSTTRNNFAPRVGVAYKLNSKGDFVLRGGWGLFYDLGNGNAAGLLTQFPNAATQLAFSLPIPLANSSAVMPVFSTQPPYQSASYISGFSPNLQLPRSSQWNVAAEKSLGSRQAISATYVGQVGSRLLRVEDQAAPNANFQSPFLLTTNSGSSNYDALQLQYRRPLAAGLQVLADYTWSHSIDNDSNDFYSVVSQEVISARNDRASSDFDVRHNFAGAFTYNLPSLKAGEFLSRIIESWGIDGVVEARSGFPVNVISSSITLPGISSETSLRPDIVQGAPLWLAGSQYPGGKALNPAAFDAATPASQGRQGDLGRNAIPGFGLAQVDLSLSRRFGLREGWNLQFRADAFNVFNHPNFANPVSNLSNPLFGLSNQMLNRGLSGFGGGLSSLYQIGGPRSLQLSLKLLF